MIDLSRSREQMLLDIRANADGGGVSLADPADPRFRSAAEIRLVMEAIEPAALLAPLSEALAVRFGDLSAAQLDTDLLIPLKKAVGNAWKWGNRKDPAKRVRVETIVTGSGAVISVDDEGPGFDVPGLLERFRRDQRYWSHGGSGFVHFKKSGSVVSYANGGSTVHIRFLREPDPGRPLTAAEREALGPAGDGTFMRAFLGGQLPRFDSPDDVASCRVYRPEEWAQDDTEIAYVLRPRGGKPNRPTTLIGRLLPAARAREDYLVATHLYQLKFNGERRLRIPRPVAVFDEPGLVLYEFAPASNLRGHLTRVREFGDVAPVLRAVALGLRVLHESPVAIERAHRLPEMLARTEAVGWRSIHQLGARHAGAARRVERILEQVAQRAATIPDDERVPAHGDFGWHRILAGGERLHLFYFDGFRRAHPFFDVGAFLADLLRFYELRKKTRPQFWEAGREVFMEAYFAADPRPRHDLPFFVATALLLRLERLLKRPEKKWAPRLEPLLSRCETLVGATEL